MPVRPLLGRVQLALCPAVPEGGTGGGIMANCISEARVDCTRADHCSQHQLLPRTQVYVDHSLGPPGIGIGHREVDTSVPGHGCHYTAG